MTPLAEILIRRIKANGPLSIAEYMSECLLHPQYGYYSTRDPFGSAGDFTTAPEISQMFGELIGLCLAQVWLDQGSPDSINLVELGPGRGTLMADILRATRSVPGFHNAANVHLIEASAKLRAVQASTLADANATWHASISELPDGPLYLVANEFFDALPIRQFTRDSAGWREHQIGVADEKLVQGLSAPAPLQELDYRLDDTLPGDIVELCPAARPIMQQIGEMLGSCGGVALVIDYGEWRSKGDTFQALQNHAFTDPLENPGNADLTAHVDFEALSKAAEGATCSEITTQGVFLERLGISARAQILAKNLRGTALESHVAAHRRLTHTQEMGNLFKTIALIPVGCSPPPGFLP